MKNWKEALITEDATVRDAMRTLNQSSLRVVLVVQEGNKLLGTVTDGDIRRGLLKDVNMGDKVTSVTNLKPVTINPQVSKREALNMLEDLDLLALPVVDNNGYLIELYILSNLLIAEPKENPVFLMAGGFGTRLKPLTDNCPKPMLPVGEKPLLEHQLNQLTRQGFRNFYISTHYMPEVIKEHFGDGSDRGISITYVHENEPLGTGGALGLLPDSLPELPLIMMNGDVLTDLDFSELLDTYDESGCDSILCTRELEHNVPYGVVETAKNTVKAMVEKPTYRYEINTGIYLLSHKCVRSVRKNELLDMPCLLKRRMDEGLELNSYVHRGYWLDIGHHADYQKAQTDIKALGIV